MQRYNPAGEITVVIRLDYLPKVTSPDLAIWNSPACEKPLMPSRQLPFTIPTPPVCSDWCHACFKYSFMPQYAVHTLWSVVKENTISNSSVYVHWCSLDCADVFQDTNTHCAEGCHPIAGTLLSITEFSHLLGSHLRLHSIAFHHSIHLAQQAIHQLCSSNSAGFWFVSY